MDFIVESDCSLLHSAAPHIEQQDIDLEEWVVVDCFIGDPFFEHRLALKEKS